jgi:hypothetical protein
LGFQQLCLDGKADFFVSDIALNQSMTGLLVIHGIAASSCGETSFETREKQKII